MNFLRIFYAQVPPGAAGMQRTRAGMMKVIRSIQWKTGIRRAAEMVNAPEENF